MFKRSVQPLAALLGVVLCREWVVSGIFPLLAEVVAADFAMDGGAVAAQLLGNLRHRYLGVQQAKDRAALVESELPVGSRHEAGSVVQAAEKHTESHFELEST